MSKQAKAVPTMQSGLQLPSDGKEHSLNIEPQQAHDHKGQQGQQCQQRDRSRLHCGSVLCGLRV
jgi:hypothetical protein